MTGKGLRTAVALSTASCFESRVWRCKITLLCGKHTTSCVLVSVECLRKSKSKGTNKSSWTKVTTGQERRPVSSPNTDIHTHCVHHKMAHLILPCCQVNNVDCAGRTPLHLSAEHGHEDVARILVVKGASVHVTDAKGQTPLHLASRRGHVKMVRPDMFWNIPGHNVPKTESNDSVKVAEVWGEGQEITTVHCLLSFNRRFSKYMHVLGPCGGVSR